MATYLNDLITIFQNKLTRSNKEWFQFVCDHTQLIIQNSSFVTLSLNDLHKYRYRPVQLFKPLGLSKEDTWIVMLINNIESTNGIPYHISTVYAPNAEFITTLKNRFKAFQKSLAEPT